jgi:hypothetical protein
MPKTAEAQSAHHFKKGDVVNVINCAGHRFVLEGRATIVRPVRDIDDQYIVRFFEAEGAGTSRLSPETYERFIDPRAQDGALETFLAELNAPRPVEG